MLLSVMVLIVGCGLLAWGADRFVTGASATARNFGVSPLVVGIVLVGFATSVPEMLVAGIAAWEGNPAIGIGNAVGSNIANIGLVLGITALVKPLIVNSKFLRREFPLLLVSMVYAFFVIINGQLTRGDGVLLLIGFVVLMGWMLTMAIRAKQKGEPMAAEYAAEIPSQLSTTRASVWLVFGFLLLIVSSRMMVYGAVNIAKFLGVSDLVIGLTIVAVGTSLPELASSILCTIRGEYEIALGNIIGSNVFNVLPVLAMPALIHPGPVPSSILTRDFPVMLVFTLALIIMAYGFRGRPGRINRYEGACLLVGFCVYLAWLYHAG